MGQTQLIVADPALARLHEVTARIRARAAEGRERAAARARARERRAVPLRLQPMLPLRAPAPPRHWADGRDE